jgi:hypothetical protein
MTNEDLEIIYILENVAMPGFLKIGRTKDLAARIAGLSNTTSVPFPFTCAYAAKVQDAEFVEQQLHIIFAQHRASPRREFFTAPLDSAIAAIRLVSVAPVSASVAESKSIDRVSEKAYASVSDAPETNVISREEALRDLQAMLASGASFSSQEDLARKWGRPSQTVSNWVIEWERIGAIPPRQTTGRTKLIALAT